MKKLIAATVVCGLMAFPASSSQNQTEASQMVLPDAFKTDVVVLERSESTLLRPSVDFLPYRVSQLKRGISWDEMWELFDVTVEAPTDPNSLSFTLSDDAAELWKVACRWKRTSDDWPVKVAGDSASVGIEEGVTLQCYLSPVGSDQRWTLQVERAPGTPRHFLRKRNQQAPPGAEAFRPAGRLSDGKVILELSVSHAEKGGKLVGIPFVDVKPAGYLFTLDQQPLAAVTTEPAGRLIFRHSVDPAHRSLIAAAACALLLI